MLKRQRMLLQRYLAVFRKSCKSCTAERHTTSAVRSSSQLSTLSHQTHSSMIAKEISLSVCHNLPPTSTLLFPDRLILCECLTGQIVFDGYETDRLKQIIPLGVKPDTSTIPSPAHHLLSLISNCLSASGPSFTLQSILDEFAPV